MRRIVAAALMHEYRLHTLPPPARHKDIIASEPKGSLSGAQQGFLTDSHEFVSRSEGYKIAEEAGQLLEPGRKGNLRTEDLW